jgi:hypothetical protein
MKCNYFLGALLLTAPSILYGDGILSKAQKMVGTAVSLPFAYKNASANTENYVNEVMEKLSPGHEKVQVKTMNKFAEYLLGYQNAVALPGLNTLLVNEDWFKKLPEEQKRFLVGRSLVHMDKPLEYGLYKYVLPFLINTYLELSSNREKIERLAQQGGFGFTLGRPLTRQQQRLANLTAWNGTKGLLGNLMKQYFSRQLEYQADKEAVEKLDCAEGGIKLLQDISKFKYDKTSSGKWCSTIPVFEILHYIMWFTAKLRIDPEFTFLPIKELEMVRRRRHEVLPWYLRAYPQVTVQGINLAKIFPLWTLMHLKDNVPARLASTSNRLENFIHNLPLVHYFWSYPRTEDRIAALKAVAHTLAKEKEKTQEKPA